MLKFHTICQNPPQSTSIRHAIPHSLFCWLVESFLQLLVPWGPPWPLVHLVPPVAGALRPPTTSPGVGDPRYSGESPWLGLSCATLVTHPLLVFPVTPRSGMPASSSAGHPAAPPLGRRFTLRLAPKRGRQKRRPRAPVCVDRGHLAVRLNGALMHPTMAP